MDFELVKLEIEGAVAMLSFNDPDSLNAISAPMLRGLNEALDHIEDPAQGIRCVVLTGIGRGFCAGANLTATSENSGRSITEGRGNRPPDVGAGLETQYHPLLRRLRNLPCPLVSAVNGPCAGVGVSFALMGDMVLAAKSAFFLQAFRRIGLVPDGGSTYLLPRLIGMARAKELAIMGERLPAERALEWGLINRVYEDDALATEAKKLASELAAGPMSLSLIRGLMWDSVDSTYEEQLNKERWAQQTAGRTDDFAEGVKAFTEKRPANFKGE